MVVPTKQQKRKSTKPGMSKHMPLPESIRLIAQQTDSRYYEQASECLQPLMVSRISQSETIRELINSACRSGVLLAPQDCYWNAYSLAYILEEQGVTYVEGLFLGEGCIFAHAWIGHEGKFYDPTLEFLDKWNKDLPGWKPFFNTNHEYAALIEMSASDLQHAAAIQGMELEDLIPPFAPYLWSLKPTFPGEFTPQYPLETILGLARARQAGSAPRCQGRQ